MSVFIDTNVAIYAISRDHDYRERALEIITQIPHISTQVVLETVNASMKKLSYPKENAFRNADYLLRTTILHVITEEIIRKAFQISLRYDYAHWDSLIIASALEAECNILYSEDFQDGQVIEGMKIINPFL